MIMYTALLFSLICIIITIWVYHINKQSYYGFNGDYGRRGYTYSYYLLPIFFGVLAVWSSWYGEHRLSSIFLILLGFSIIVKFYAFYVKEKNNLREHFCIVYVILFIFLLTLILLIWFTIYQIENDFN